MAQRSNINLTQAEYLLECTYLNQVKRWQRFIRNGGGTAGSYSTIDQYGYPNEAVTGQYGNAYFVEAGTYAVRWTGSGSVTFDQGTSKTDSSSGIYTGGGSAGGIVTNGRYTFVVAAAGTYLCTIKGTTIQNLACFKISGTNEETIYDAGVYITRPIFRQRIAEFSPDSLRFMDMQATNISGVGYVWADRPSVNQISYNNTVVRPLKNVGNITGAANTYTAASYTGMPGSYTHGEIIHGYVTNSNTSAVMTINVGGRGAVSVLSAKYPSGTLGTGTDHDARILNDLDYTFVYDANRNSWNFYPEGLPSGTPIEALISICNDTATAGWFCIPFYASDAWVTSFANLLVSTYTPSTVKIEFCNETWNSANGFLNYPRCQIAGSVSFGTGASLESVESYTGLRFRQIMQIMQPIFAIAGQSAKLKGVLASYGGWDSATVASVVENQLMQNTRTNLSGTLGTPSANLSGANAPYQFATDLSFGVYWVGKRIAGYTDGQWDAIYTAGPNTISDITAQADNFALGTAAAIDTAYQWLYADLTNVASSVETTVKGASGYHAIWNTLATTYSKRISVYEANQEFGAPSTSWCTGKSISTTYGGIGGKIDLMIEGFKASTYFERVNALLLQDFYSRSQSDSYSVYSMGIQRPWNCFPQVSTGGTLGGDVNQTGMGNWSAHAKRNKSVKPFKLVTS